MKKPWIIFLICIAAGIVLTATFSTQQVTLSDKPEKIPSKEDIVTPGLSTFDITRTSDESMIPEMMQPTSIVKLVTKRLLDASCSHGTALCELQAIYDFVRTQYLYTPTSQDHNYIQSAGETLLQGKGNDLELGILLTSMQRAAGFKNEILRGPYHTFVRVKNGNDSIMMDPSCQGCNFMDVRVALRGDEDIFS